MCSWHLWCSSFQNTGDDYCYGVILATKWSLECRRNLYGKEWTEMWKDSHLWGKSIRWRKAQLYLFSNGKEQMQVEFESNTAATLFPPVVSFPVLPHAISRVAPSILSCLQRKFGFFSSLFFFWIRVSVNLPQILANICSHSCNLPKDPPQMHLRQPSTV